MRRRDYQQRRRARSLVHRRQGQKKLQRVLRRREYQVVLRRVWGLAWHKARRRWILPLSPVSEWENRLVHGMV